MALHGQDGHANGQQTGGAPKPENRRPPQPAGPVDAGPARANAPRPPALLHSADGRPQPPGGQVCLVKSNNFTTSTAHFISIFAARRAAQRAVSPCISPELTITPASGAHPMNGRRATSSAHRHSVTQCVVGGVCLLPMADRCSTTQNAKQGRAGCSLSVTPARRVPATDRAGLAGAAPVHQGFP